MSPTEACPPIDVPQGESIAYLTQISEDFEELTFLRNLSEHLELAEVSQDVWHVARTVLPLLCGLIRANTLVLVGAGRDPGAAAAGQSVGALTIRTGATEPNDETCVRLVQRFHTDAAAHPLVVNRFSTAQTGAAFEGVEDFILVQVAKADLVVGWLLALNYRGAVAGPERLSDHEFGSVEASLIKSAASMLATHARNVELFKEKESLLVAVVRALVLAIDAKDPYTCGHSERVALVARRLGQQMQLGELECERLYLTGLLHDVGKIGVRDAVLCKPGKLTPEEFDEMKRHPDDGCTILQDLDQLAYVLPGVLYHHERFGGGGYPDGLVGQEIPLEARILAVADAYDAMTSDRAYRKGMVIEEVENIFRSGAGSQWDPAVIEAFFTAKEAVLEISRTYERPIRRPRKTLTSPLPAGERAG